MKKIILLLITIIFISFSANAQLSFNTYHDRTKFLLTSPGSMKFGVYGYGNPAILSTINQPDILFQWSDDPGFTDFDNWGIFTGVPHVGFGVFTQQINGMRLTDNRLSISFGDESRSTGISYGWYGGDFDFDEVITLGSLFRPSRFISIGAFGTRSLQRADYEGVLDLGIRPFGTEHLTFFGDYAVNSEQGFEDALWSAGAAIEALPGIRFTGRYIHDTGITAGVQFSLGRIGTSFQAHFDADHNHAFNTYGVRFGAYDRNIADAFLAREQNYMNLSMRGERPYQSRRFFDDSVTFMETLQAIEDARLDPSIGGVVVKAYAMSIHPSLVSEISQEFQKFREADKKVILYLERGGMSSLHLISAADVVIMDPEGALVLPGYLSGSTYLADLFAQVGIGVDEFREMEYKSALETISRREMSEADREQRMELVNFFYETTRKGVLENRQLTEVEYDSLINFSAQLLPKELVEAGLVDRLVRYADINSVLEEIEGMPVTRIESNQLLTSNRPDDHYWGSKPEIGVLYAIGPTLTETGIRARTLASEIKKMRNDANIRAIVMRVDSPGGDALASDLVAEEIRKTTEVKPVIISMGAVAASGGYWISMYADSIVALPYTLTGSIGVIGGWFYDDGFSDNLRLHTDFVKRGESADLMFGPSLPLIGLTIPGRDLTDQERRHFVDRLNQLYDRFIEKVADGRGAEFDEIREVAAGRVWSGTDALDQNLIDETGTLFTAIQMAKDAAGIGEDEEFNIVEGPEPPLFRLPQLLSIFGIDEPPAKDPMTEYLEMMLDHNGIPLLLMPFEYYHLHYMMME